MESKEVLELIHKAKAGNNEATEKLIEQYLNAVRKINNKWGGTDDGFQEGILGIYEAIKTYDFSYNTKFLTHLYPNIEARIRRFIDKENYRVSYNAITEIKKGRRDKIQFQTYEGLEIEDKNINNVDLEEKTFVAKLLDCCTKQEKYIIKKLYFDGYSGEEVAKQLKVSRQRVHIAKHNALAKMRKVLNGRN